MRISDWSSDVCSSDLRRDQPVEGAPAPARHRAFVGGTADAIDDLMALPPEIKHLRDKLRRVLQVAIELNRAIARCRLVGGEQRALIAAVRSEEHTSELQSLMRISYAVFCLKKQKNTRNN